VAEPARYALVLERAARAAHDQGKFAATHIARVMTAPLTTHPGPATPRTTTQNPLSDRLDARVAPDPYTTLT
jgi:hypothetical protein